MLSLPPRGRQALAAHRARGAGGDELVFITETGRPVYPRTLTLAYERALRRAGVPHVVFRALRHGAASLLPAGGVPPAIVQANLGHATPHVTLSIYNRMPPAAVREAMARMESLLGAPDEELSSDVPSERAEAGDTLPKRESERGTPDGIRTRDLHLERVAS